jgi:phosphoglycolate phosphatase-like HAD superfamily hydrolase
MSTRAMIFDFDGTIADTLGAAVGVLNSLADEYGYRVAQPEELPLLRTLSPRQITERMGLAWHKLPSLVMRVRKEMTRNMSSIMPFAGIAAALQGLRERGVRVGMLTSNSRENVAAFLAHQPSLQFDFISTGTGLFSKHVRLKRVLRSQGLAASDSFYVGDEVRDIEAAREVGLRMIAVSWGFADQQLLAASGPDHLITRPEELLTLV